MIRTSTESANGTAGTVVRPRVAIVDPRGLDAERASALLASAWSPPCLHYTAEYLRWQFAFAGAPPPRAAVALDGDDLVGLLVALPRRLRTRAAGRPAAIHFLSFGAVRPGCRGPLGVALYRALLAALRGDGLPALAFAPPGGAGGALLTATARATGFAHRRLGNYASYLYLSGRPGDAGEYIAAEARPAEYLAVAARWERAGVLAHAPGPDGIAHYLADPRGRALLVVREAGGAAVGAAMTSPSEVVTRRGLERVATVDNLFLLDPSAGALRALLEDAGRRGRDRTGSPVVTVPNACGIDPGLLAAVGLRASPSSFDGHLLTPGDGGPGDIGAINIDISG